MGDVRIGVGEMVVVGVFVGVGIVGVGVCVDTRSIQTSSLLQLKLEQTLSQDRKGTQFDSNNLIA